MPIKTHNPLELRFFIGGGGENCIWMVTY